MKKFWFWFFCVAFVGILTFFVVWGSINYTKVKEGLSGTGLYTKEDLTNAKKEGYEEALKDKAAYDDLVKSLRDKITIQADDLSKANGEIVKLENSNKKYLEDIAKLNKDKQGLTTERDNLIVLKTQNEATIAQNNVDIANYLSQIAILGQSDSDKAAEIVRINKIVDDLRVFNAQLQSDNAEYANTIAILNSKVTTLNAQIVEINNQYAESASLINTLNAKIVKLEQSIAYYEQYIAQLENGDQVTATFEFNHAIYNIQIINKGTSPSITDPESTPYVRFNGWLKDGVSVVPGNCVLHSSAKFVADVTYLYDAKFSVEGEIKSSQIIESGNFATKYEVESTAYKVFNGYKVNNEFVDVETYPITQNTLFVADFTYKHDVNFVVGDATAETKIVEHNAFASTTLTPTKTGYDFLGWSLNGTDVVSLATTRIQSNTTFVALFKIKTLTLKFVDEQTSATLYETTRDYGQVVGNIDYTPSKPNYEFLGWYIGSDNVSLATYSVTSNVTFTAKFRLLAINVYFQGQSVSVIQGQKIANVPSYTGAVPAHKTFAGWTLDGVNAVDFSTYVVTSSVTFSPLFADKAHHAIADFNTRREYGGSGDIKTLKDSVFAQVDSSATYVSFTLTITAYSRASYTSSRVMGTKQYTVTLDRTNNVVTCTLNTAKGANQSRDSALNFTLQVSLVNNQVVGAIINYDANNNGAYDPSKYDDPCGIDITLSGGYYEI